MRRHVLLSIFVLCILCGNSYGFEIKGLQPVDPYGVFSTFSAESFPRGKAAFSTGADLWLSPNQYGFIFKTAYGITDNLELDLTTTYHGGSGTPGGFEDLALGLKHRFFEEGKYGPSLAYVLTASLPSGRESLSTEGSYGIGLIVSKTVGPVNGHANFFYIKPGNGKLEDEVSFLAGLDFAASHNFKILAELFCRKSYFSDKIDTVEGRFGYRIKTTDSIYTTFGLGSDFKRRNPATRAMFTVTFLLPKEKKKIEKLYEEEK